MMRKLAVTTVFALSLAALGCGSSSTSNKPDAQPTDVAPGKDAPLPTDTITTPTDTQGVDVVTSHQDGGQLAEVGVGAEAGSLLDAEKPPVDSSHLDVVTPMDMGQPSEAGPTVDLAPTVDSTPATDSAELDSAID